MIGKISRIAIGAMLAAVCVANAHLTAGSLVPKGGETLTAGASFDITWTEAVNHGNGTDIAFSKDNGKTWTDIKTGFSDVAGKNTFSWTVDTALTSTGKIRICQHGDDNMGCTDANKTQSPSTAPYTLISPSAFTVSNDAAILPVAAGSDNLSLRFNAATRNLDVTFVSAQGQNVLIQATDAGGRVVATLLNAKQDAGFHQMSIFSNRLNAANGTLVFQIKLGETVHAQIWNAVR